MIRLARNRHPVDELADVRAEIKRLKLREAALRRAVIASGDLVGAEFEAILKHSIHERVDVATLKQHFSAEVLRPFLREQACEQLRIKPRKEEEER